MGMIDRELRHDAGPAGTASALLTIDLAAIAENYRALAARAGTATCAAVVKADAYGLGADRVAPVLAAAGTSLSPRLARASPSGRSSDPAP